MEVQESFYNLPRLATVQRWRQSAPPQFEFVLKAPQVNNMEMFADARRFLRLLGRGDQPTERSRRAPPSI